MHIINLVVLFFVLLLGGCNLTGSSTQNGAGPINPPTPPIPPGPTSDCFDSDVLFPAGTATADFIFPNYTNPGPNRTVYGYNNPNHVKKITIINNSEKVIYPVVYAPNTNKLGDGRPVNLSRIYVGKPSCKAPGKFSFGLAPKKAGSIANRAVVYVPKQLWNAGHVKIFTEAPNLIQEDLGNQVAYKFYTTDTTSSSPNYGHFVYASYSDNPTDFPLDYPFQLTEYTIESDCYDEANPACNDTDKYTVDYDISYVDHLYLPIAMQQSDGMRGYVGTDYTLDNFQAQISQFVNGQGSYAISSNTQLGWPFYYGSQGARGYANNYHKLPTGYNVFNEWLGPSLSHYDNNVTTLWAMDQGSPRPGVKDLSQAILDRWTNLWVGCATNSVGVDAQQCQFMQTLEFIKKNTLKACQASLLQISSPANYPGGAAAFYQECDTAGKPRSVVTEAEKVRAALGYTFNAHAFVYNSDAYYNGTTGGPVTLAPTVPAATRTAIKNGQLTFPVDTSGTGGDICARNTLTTKPSQLPTAQDPDPLGTYYSNCFRDAIKSVLRGVPYPYWSYNDSQLYPVPSSAINLDPIVWFVHKKLEMSAYAFSVDDDLGNQELVGNGFVIAVGGTEGLPATNKFDNKYKQVIAFGVAQDKSTWQWNTDVPRTMGICDPAYVSACDLNLNDGAYQSVALNLVKRLPNGTVDKQNYLNFTVTRGQAQQCTRGPNQYSFYPLTITNCASSDPAACKANLLVTYSTPNDCARTVNVPAPQ